MLLQLSLLGEVMLMTSSSSRILRGGKGSALLIYVAYRGDWVRRASLMALLWPETPEVQARSNLRQLLLNLRRAPDVAGLEVTDTGVRWPVITDVSLFRQALAAHDLERAAQLYRGELLSDFNLDGLGDFADWLEGERGDLFSAYRSAVLEQAERVQQNAPAQAAAVLGRFLHHDPFDEEVLGERLGALAQAGEVRRALAEAEAFRARLEREFGATPDEPLQHRSAALRAALKDKRVRSGETVVLAEPAADSSTQAFRVAERPPLNTFVGRSSERETLRRRLADPACRLLTLVGPGGVGKTRLALELAAELLGSFRDGVTVVPLETVSNANLIAPALAARLGLAQEPLNAPEPQVAAHLKDAERLLVLDNFEQLLEGKTFLLTLLAGAPGVKLLVTSRERLNVTEEVLLELRGLSLESDGAQPSDAATLFLHGARRVGTTLRREAELHTVADICALVEGVPLALELTSAWLRLLTPSEVKTELSAGLDLLVAPDAGFSERHQNMRLVLARSWARLTVDEQRTLTRLSVFRGGFSYTAAKAVTGMSLGVLLALTHKSLLYRAADGRFTLHELVRHYAAEQLLAEGASKQTHAQAQHARYYLGLLGTLEMWSETETASLAVLDAEVDNLRAAWRWAVAGGRLPEFWLPSDVVVFFDRRQYFTEGLEFFEQVSVCFDPENPAHQETLATLRVDRAWLLFRLGRYAEAEALAGDSLDGSLSVKTRMKALNTLGIITRQQGRYLLAVRHIEGALALARELGEVTRVAAYLNNLGATCIFLGEYERAEEASRAALNLHRATDDAYGVVTTLIDLSSIYSAQADKRALEVVEEALELARKQSFDDVTSALLITKARVLYRLGDAAQAELICHEVMRLITKPGYIWDEAQVLNLLGYIATRRGEQLKARQYLVKSFLLAWQHREIPTILEDMLALAELEFSENAYERARQLLVGVMRHPAASAVNRCDAERFFQHSGMHQHLPQTGNVALERWVPAFFGLAGEATEREMN